MIEPTDLETLPHCPVCGHEQSRPWRQAVCVEAPDEVFTIVECAHCALRYLNPRPRPESLGRYYAPDYYSYQPGVRRPRSHRLKLLLWRRLGLLPPRPRPSLTARTVRGLVGGLLGARAHWVLPAPAPDARFLDVGGGAGHRLHLAGELGWQTWGVDLDPTGLPAARQQGHHVAAADARHLPWAAESFHFVNLGHTLEHTADPVATLAECRRVLHPRGILQITVPNADSWGSHRYGDHWRALDLPRHLYHFTPATLGDVVRRAGLEVISRGMLRDDWSLRESARLAGAPPPSLGLWHRCQRHWQLQGETLNLWCRRG